MIIQFAAGVVQAQPQIDFGQNIIVSGLGGDAGGTPPPPPTSASAFEGLRRNVGRMMR